MGAVWRSQVGDTPGRMVEIDGPAVVSAPRPQVRSVTTGSTAADGDFIVCKGGGSFAILLPTATAGASVTVYNLGDGQIDINPGPEVLEYVLQSVPAYSAGTMVSDGVTWYRMVGR